MTAKTKDVANWFINKGVEDSDFVDPMKLQKLLYLAHGWSLGVRGEPLLKSHFQAWKYGPVLPKLYKWYRDLGMQLIHETSDNDYKQLPGYVTDLLSFIWNRYKGFSSIELSSLSHEKNGPWDVTINNFKETYDSTIDNELIQIFYHKKYKEYYCNA